MRAASGSAWESGGKLTAFGAHLIEDGDHVLFG
jgi:hypothetical protein